MEHLINSYTPTTESLDSMSGFRTIEIYEDIYPAAMFHSIIMNQSEYLLNNRVLKLFNEIKFLNDNWDEDGALAPSEYAIKITQALIWQMEAIHQKIYSIAPGPSGEIMLDFRNKTKTAEIIIYPSKIRAIQFEENKTPQQSDVTIEYVITELLKWINS